MYLIVHVMGGETGIYGQARTLEEAKQIELEAIKEGAACVEIENISGWEVIES